jgi:diguanylate cyclase (GGDEF)-like protein
VTAELVERMRWVIGIRWTVVIALVLVGLLGNTIRGDAPGPSYVHLALAAFVAAYNTFYLLVTRRPEPPSTALIAAQIPLDLLVFTAIVHFSGGVTGPVFVLYFLYIFVGLAILPPAGSYLVAALAALLYGGLALVEALWLPPPGGRTAPPPDNIINTYLGYFLTVAAMLMIIAYIANYFAGLLTRDERTIRRQLDEINRLYSFSRITSRALSAEEVARSLVAAASEGERADACSLLAFTESGDAIMLAHQGLTPENVSGYAASPTSYKQSLVQVLFSKGRGVYAPDVDAVPNLRDFLVRGHTRSFYSIPMTNEDRVIGVLNLSFDKPYTMPASHWDLLVAMTQQAALAIERSRLFGDTQRAAREMTSLYHIGLAATSSIQIDEVMRLIYEQVNRVLPLDTFFICLYDEDRAELRYDLFVEAGETLPPFRTRLDTVGISAWVIRNARPMLVRHWSVEEEQLPFRTAVVGATTESVICVPLIAKNKIVGVMSAQSLVPNAFDNTHVRLVTAIASQAALALENARLHTTVNEQAQRDPLTGAYNHGTLIDKLHAAIGHAQAERGTVALIMLDLDSFKQYNDNYGHLVGDDVLRSTVAAIQSHLKSTDVVGRWGGEEFGVILPGVTRQQARAIAERIRQTVAAHELRDMHNRPIPSATASLGIALYPDDAVHIEELIHKADSALYQAKAQGRNCIAEWVEMARERASSPPRSVG